VIDRINGERDNFTASCEIVLDTILD